MSNQNQIKQRVCTAAWKVLQEQHYVAPIDVFVAIGWLQAVHVQDWRKGRIPYLEQVISCNLSKITYAMQCFRAWAKENKLIPSETAYVRSTYDGKQSLQFSKSGSLQIEMAYRTHYVSPLLPENKQLKIKENIAKPPELVVFRIDKDSQCGGCQCELQRHSFLFMDADNPLCLKCAKMDELFFLPSGDAKLTRKAKQLSATYAVVLQYSRTRKRYERQGILVETSALKACGVHTD